MSTDFLVGMCVMIVVIVAIFWFATYIDRKQVSREQPQVLTVFLMHARRRALIAVAFAVVIFGVTGIAGLALPALLGLPLAVSALLGAAAGVMLYAATPVPPVAPSATQPLTAPLQRRGLATYSSQGLGISTVGVVVLLFGYLVFTGLTASTDSYGLSRSIAFISADGERSSISGPYPGWFYGVPAVAMVILLLIAAWYAVRRISSAPIFPDVVYAGEDDLWRRTSVSIILMACLAAVLFTFGGTAVFAGLASRPPLDFPIDRGWGIFSTGSIWGGAIMVIASVVVLTLAALRAWGLPAAVRALAEKVPA